MKMLRNKKKANNIKSIYKCIWPQSIVFLLRGMQRKLIIDYRIVIMSFVLTILCLATLNHAYGL